ncbi:MAG: phosphoglucosamine mutase, partial [Bacteroidetes bacterium]|nr:phosphoglucosamine mutase [Bacteroidota bacterium]
MAILKSISGIRGTIGGKRGEGLTPMEVMRYAGAYAVWLTKKYNKPKVVIGRDARISGEMVNKIVCGALMGCGVDVIDLGLSTTPTVEMAVKDFKANGGIILTASHNPKQWNALKMLNEEGEFISASVGQKIIELAEQIEELSFPEVDDLGTYNVQNYMQEHFKHIANLPLVDIEAIKNA